MGAICIRMLTRQRLRAHRPRNRYNEETAAENRKYHSCRTNDHGSFFWLALPLHQHAAPGPPNVPPRRLKRTSFWRRWRHPVRSDHRWRMPSASIGKIGKISSFIDESHRQGRAHLPPRRRSFRSAIRLLEHREQRPRKVLRRLTPLHNPSKKLPKRDLSLCP